MMDLFNGLEAQMLTGNPRFDSFIQEISAIVATANGDEGSTIEHGRAALAELVAEDDWLPEAFAEPHPDHFKQYMLYKEPEQRFTVLCVVWGPGQSAIPHDHTVWGIIGQLRGAERTRLYEDPEPGKPLRIRSEEVLRPGQTTVVAPGMGDVHDVENAIDGISISIHVYGGDLASLADRRHRYDAESGKVMPFITSYY